MREPATSPAAAAEAAEHPSRRPCPRCGSRRVYRSHRRGFIEHALALLGLKMRRCHACHLRFTRLGGSVLLVSDIERLLRRLALAALVLAGLALSLAAMFWFSARQASLAAPGLLVLGR